MNIHSLIPSVWWSLTPIAKNTGYNSRCLWDDALVLSNTFTLLLWYIKMFSCMLLLRAIQVPLNVTQCVLPKSNFHQIPKLIFQILFPAVCHLPMYARVKEAIWCWKSFFDSFISSKFYFWRCLMRHTGLWLLFALKHLVHTFYDVRSVWGEC